MEKMIIEKYEKELKKAYTLLFVTVIAFVIVGFIDLGTNIKPPKTVTQEIHELANDWKPDWSDPHQLKYYIYDGPEGPSIGESNVRRIYGVSYFKTASQAGEAMLHLGDKLRVRE